MRVFSFLLCVGAVGCGSSQSSGAMPAADAGTAGTGGATVDGGTDASPGTGGTSCAFGSDLTTFGPGAGAAIAITTDASGVYWTDTEGAIWRADPGGASATKLITIPGVGSALAHIAVHDDTLFVHATALGVYTVPTSGGTAKFLGYTGVSSFAVDDSGFYYVGPGGELFRGDAESLQQPVSLSKVSPYSVLALDADFVYTTGVTLGAVARVPKAGGYVEDVVSTNPYPGDETSGREIAVDDVHVYWLNSSAKVGALLRAPKTGGEPELLAADLRSPLGMVLDASAVYVTIRGDAGTVAKFPLGGGPFQTFQTSQSDEDGWRVAVDASFVYVTTKVVGAPVLRACK